MGAIESTELIQAIGALIFLVGILIGSYWFVYAPVHRENKERLKNEEDSGTSSTSSS